MNKVCTKCNKTLPTLSFSRCRASADGLQAHCKECKKQYRKNNAERHKEVVREYQANNRDSINRKARERRAKHLNRLIEDLGGLKCSMCGFKDEYIGCYDFHHKDMSTKEHNLGSIMLHNFTKIKEEADKCVLVCSNCHRKIHRREEIGNN